MEEEREAAALGNEIASSKIQGLGNQDGKNRVVEDGTSVYTWRSLEASGSVSGTIPAEGNGKGTGDSRAQALLPVL